MNVYGQDNRRIAGNTMVIWVRMLTIIVIGLLCTRFVFQALGTSDTGLYSVVGGLIAMLGFLSSAMTATTRRYLNIEMGRPDGDANKVFNICRTLHVALAAVIFLLAETLGMYYVLQWLNVAPGKLPDAVFVFQVSVVTACLNIVNMPCQALMESYEKFFQTSLIDISANVFRLVCCILLLRWPGNGLRFYALVMCCMTLGSMLLYRLYCRRHWPDIVRRKRFRDRALYREIFAFNTWSALGAGASLARTNGSGMIINFFFGTVVNGAFSVAFQLENFAWMSVNRISNTAAPQITRNYEAGDRGRSLDLVGKISRFSALLMTVLVFCGLSELDLVLGLWLKEVPPGALLYCRWTLVSALVRSFTGGTSVLEQATGRIKWFQIISSTLSLACLPAGWLLYRFGAQPVAIVHVYIAYTVIYRIVELVLLRRMIGFDVAAYLREAYLRPLAVVGAMMLYLGCYRCMMPAEASVLLRLSGIVLTFLVAGILTWSFGILPSERGTVLRYFRNIRRQASCRDRKTG